MRKIFISLLALVSLVSCHEDKSYIIEGALYGGGKFEGETIYLVPFENPGNRIDSAFVHEGRFRFEGTVETEEICRVRMRPMMRRAQCASTTRSHFKRTNPSGSARNTPGMPEPNSSSGGRNEPRNGVPFRIAPPRLSVWRKTASSPNRRRLPFARLRARNSRASRNASLASVPLASLAMIR